MMFKKIVIAALFLAAAERLVAQNSLPMADDIAQAFAKQTRSASGKPGPLYWQNRASYQLHVNFEPTTLEVSGTVDIAYSNNSPDTLKQAVFKLYPNLYKKGAGGRIAAADQHDGVKILQLTAGGELTPAPEINGTNMVVTLPRPLLPGKTLSFSVTYSYPLNKGSHNRTGRVDDGSYFIAYFFPRIAVYDDINGWNMLPYRGSEEFYNDFCDFEATLSLPEKYVVWATGDLQNASEVLRPKIVKRLADAGKSDAVTDVIDSNDLARGEVTTPGRHTWKFSAKNVTDFAFATSDHYLWKSSSLVVDPATKRRTRVDAVFNPEHKDYYEVIDFARKTVQAMSFTFPKWPFPYSHETVFDGLDQMEYPMMVNDNPTQKRENAITLTDHEIFHTMFPFYMGINETKYGWMDEGWATIGEWLISPMIDPMIDDDYGMSSYNRAAGTKGDLPIMTLTTLPGGNSQSNTYGKPGMGYLFVKDLLGDKLFTKALHHYIANWNGKHPVPHDFFNSMNAGSGRDLNWFWKNWFFDNGAANLGIASVEQDGKHCVITIARKGAKFLPVDLTVTYADQTTAKFHRTVAAWQNGETTAEISFKTSRPVQKVVLGSTHIPDTDTSDNTWEKK